MTSGRSLHLFHISASWFANGQEKRDQINFRVVCFFSGTNIKWCLCIRLVNVLTFSIVLLGKHAHFHNQCSIVGKTCSNFIDLRSNPHWSWANSLASLTQISQPGNEDNVVCPVKSLWGLEARHGQGIRTKSRPSVNGSIFSHRQ